MQAFLAIAGLMAASAPTPAAITIRDPSVFLKQLGEMGYAPDAYEAGDTTLTTVIHLRQETLALVLAGCEKGRNCRYLVAVGSFTDIATPPTDWVARMNADYDLIKVWTNDEKRLSYSDGAVVEGMPRETFRSWIDEVVVSSDALGQEALKAGLAKR